MEFYLQFLLLYDYFHIHVCTCMCMYVWACPCMILYNHWIGSSSTLLDIVRFLPKVVIHIYNRTNSIWKFLLFWVLTNTSYYQTFYFCHSSEMKFRLFLMLICISLTTTNSCILLCIYWWFPQALFCKYSACFPVRWFVFLLLIWKYSLSVLDIYHITFFSFHFVEVLLSSMFNFYFSCYNWNTFQVY